MFFKNIKINKRLALILLFAFILWIWNIGAVDFVSDDATYSFRALGYFDYLAAENNQSTPVTWFNNTPIWANLSFHDAPPLVFLIQKIFFSIFGDNPFSARIPFILSGLGTVFLLFLIGKELFSKQFGYIAASLMAVLSFSTWVMLTGYLEGIGIFFLTLSIYFWIKFNKYKNKKYIYWWAVAVGLAFLVKYTLFFLLPLFLLHALLFNRQLFKTKQFYLSLLIILLIFSPVIIYNIKIFQARGHFDAAMSSLFGMHPADFKSISGRGIKLNIIQAISSILGRFHASISLPFIILFYLSWLAWAYSCFVKKIKNQVAVIIPLGFLIGLLFLSFGAGSIRFIIILLPLWVLICAFIIDFAISHFSKYKKMIFTILIIFFTWEFFYNLNSNFFIKPISSNSLIHATDNIAIRKLGFNQLDSYLKKEVLPSRLTLRRPQALIDIDTRAIETLEQSPVIYFFDDSVNWFAHNWYFRKYSNYYGLPMIPLYEQTKTLGTANPFTHFTSLGIHDYYFIYAVHPSVIDPVKINLEVRQSSDLLASMLNQNQTEAEEIKNYSGEVVFKIYKFSL